MTVKSERNEYLIFGMRWVARLLSLVAVIPFAVFLVDAVGGLSPALTWDSPQGMPLLVVMALGSVGVIVAWRWERLGGLLAAISGVVIIALVAAGSGLASFVPALLASAPFVVAGLLYLGCCAGTSLRGGQ